MYKHVLDDRGQVIGFARIENMTPSVRSLSDMSDAEREAARLQRLAWTSHLRWSALYAGGWDADALRWQREASIHAEQARFAADAC